MILTFEVTSEEAERVERAKTQGVDVNALLRNLIAQLPSEALPDTDAEWEADMRALSEGCEKLPVLASSFVWATTCSTPARFMPAAPRD